MRVIGGDELHVRQLILDTLKILNRQRIIRWRRQNKPQAQFSAGSSQRPGDIVTVTDERQSSSGQLAEVFFNGQHIRHGLAGVGIVGQTIDDGYGGVLG